MSEDLAKIKALADKDALLWRDGKLDMVAYSLRRTVFVEIFRAVAKTKDEFERLLICEGFHA